MQKKDIIRRNPLRLMGYDTDDVLQKGGFGALMARAGVGKTAFIVQLALDKLLRNKNVLHISLTEPVDKVCLWYEEVFRNIALQYGIRRLETLWETILPNRFIMTFKVDGFTVPKLEERLTDLTEQGIFFPQLILIDGFPFTESSRETFDELKRLAKDHGVAVWFTVKTHRHEGVGEADEIPAPLKKVSDLFEVALELHPDGNEIHVKAVKGGPNGEGGILPLVLDPSTMLIKDNPSLQTPRTGA